MGTAARNNQKKFNLWKWPDSNWVSDANPSTVFAPKYWVWCTASTNGYLDKNMNFSFTKSSVTTHASAYHSALFTDLDAGKYVIEFDVDSPGMFVIVLYSIESGNDVKYHGTSFIKYPLERHSAFEFEIPAGYVAMLHFDGRPSTNNMTVTNIHIRKGVL